MHKSNFKKNASEILITLIGTISIFPFVTRSITSIKNGIENLSPALDVYYYQRVFNLDNNLFQLGDIYVDSRSFEQRQINTLSIGELLQKFFYHLFDDNIIITYFIFSFLLLFAWIFLIARLITYDYPESFLKNIFVTTVMLLIFVGNTNLINSNYPFARIMSPQISIFLGLISLILINKILKVRASKTPAYKYIIQFSLLIFVASFTYLYTFLSLFGTGLVVILFLATQKKYIYLVWFTIFILISIFPFVIINYIKSKEERFKDAGERMGLIKSHYPGSLTTIIICAIIMFSLLSYKYFLTKKDPYSNIELALMASSTGLFLASQSNIVTGTEIQFYHFNLFAKINLMLFLILVINRIKFKKIQNQFSFFGIILIALLSTTLILHSLNKIILPLLFDNKINTSVELLKNKYNSETKLIVDVVNLQNTFPVYSYAKLLYQSDITTYGYTNREILERAYISAGCPSEISGSLKLELEVYRAEATYMKGKALEKYLKLFSLDKYFASSYKSKLDAAFKERSLIQSEINNYLIAVNKNSCISMANKYEIDSIIFDEKSHWRIITKNEGLPINSFTFQGKSLYEYNLRKAI